MDVHIERYPNSVAEGVIYMSGAMTVELVKKERVSCNRDYRGRTERKKTVA